MKRSALGWRVALMTVALAVGSLVAPAGAWAQGEDKWSFVLTPQVWVAHIAKNGFNAANALPTTQFDLALTQNPWDVTNSQPDNGVNPQWGLQFAAQKGRWTLAGSVQYVTFETRNTLTMNNTYPVLCPPPPPGAPPGFAGFFPVCAPAAVGPLAQYPGQQGAQEFVSTTRVDTDFSASYFFPDVVKDRIDMSLGVGLKFIYADSNRQFSNMSPFVAVENSATPPGLYMLCASDNCRNAQGRFDATFQQKVKSTDYIYGITFPISTIISLTQDKKWLLPFNVSPFVGAETRDDNNVVYDLSSISLATCGSGGRQCVSGVSVKRLDGTTFAYGVTADATVRYLLNDMLSVYAGMRVQYIEGHETFLAYGPLIGMSARW
jgi:hypothetical protein